jgi:membrane fusion protein, multidrug efflux system
MATSVKQDTVNEAPDINPEAPEPKGKRRIVLPIAIVVVLIAGYWAFGQWRYSQSHVTTDDASIDGHLVPVLAKVGGYVQAVTVAENSHVANDSLLVQIDPSEYNIRLAQADADLAAARAATGTAGLTGQAQAAVESAANQRASLESQIDAARASDAKARADLSRMKELAAKQIVSRQQLDAAQAAAESAAASLQSLQRQAAMAGSNITNAQAGVRLASARLQAAVASRENAAVQLGYTKITAPEAGIVSRKQVEVGQLVQPGQPVLTIVSDTGVWVTANFKETQLTNMKAGQKAVVKVDAYGGKEFQAHVDSIAAATGARFSMLPPENATGNYVKVVQRVPVKIVLEPGQDPDHLLRPGMSVVPMVYTK